MKIVLTWSPLSLIFINFKKNCRYDNVSEERSCLLSFEEILGIIFIYLTLRSCSCWMAISHVAFRSRRFTKLPSNLGLVPSVPSYLSPFISRVLFLSLWRTNRRETWERGWMRWKQTRILGCLIHFQFLIFAKILLVPGFKGPESEESENKARGEDGKGKRGNKGRFAFGEKPGPICND